MVSMNDGFTVDTAQLRQAEGNIYSCYADIAGMVSTLMAQLEPSKSQWRGATATAFHEVWTRWEGDMQKIAAALMDLGHKVGRASGSYQLTEVTQRQNASKIIEALAGGNAADRI